MSTTTTNGKPQRKQLADQLDRLDSMIDVLGTGLNQAVADACREGARAAVREVILELIANPDLMGAIRSAPASLPVESPPACDEPPAPPAHRVSPAPQSFGRRVKIGVKNAGRAVSGAARTLVQTVVGAVKPATDAIRLTGTAQKVVAVAIGVGLAAGAVSLVCPAWAGVLISAGAGVAAVAAAHVGATVNALWARFRLA